MTLWVTILTKSLPLDTRGINVFMFFWPAMQPCYVGDMSTNHPGFISAVWNLQLFWTLDLYDHIAWCWCHPLSHRNDFHTYRIKNSCFNCQTKCGELPRMENFKNTLLLFSTTDWRTIWVHGVEKNLPLMFFIVTTPILVSKWLQRWGLSESTTFKTIFIE